MCIYITARSLLTSQTSIWDPGLSCFNIIQPGIKRMYANIILQSSGLQYQVKEDDVSTETQRNIGVVTRHVTDTR